MDSVELYRTLDCGWVECGGLRLASSEARWEETRRQAGWAKTFGLPLELLSAEEAQERFPLMTTDGVLGASWLPTDGYLDPSLLTYALAEQAREGGCDIHINTRVTGIDVRGGRVRGVQTERGDIEADVVVNAGGMYAAEIGRMAGVRVPLVPMAHEYLVTQPFRDRDPDEPLPDHARPRPPHLLPRGRGRPGDGRLRAPLQAVGARRGRRRRDPRRLQRPPARGGLGALRGDHRQRPQARAGARRGHDHEADQRAGGVHARRRVPARRVARARASSSPPASAPTGSRARAGWAS